MPIPFPKHAKQVCKTNELTVYEWEQKLFDGTTAIYDGCARRDTVAVIPFLDSETVLLVREEQPGMQPFWDVPGGKVDPGEEHLDAAKREMLEETGFVPGVIECWRRKAWEGVIRCEESVFVAKNLVRKPEGKHLDPGERLQEVPTPWKKVVEMCLRHELRRPDVMLAIVGMEFDPQTKTKIQKFLAP